MRSGERPQVNHLALERFHFCSVLLYGSFVAIQRDTNFLKAQTVVSFPLRA